MRPDTYEMTAPRFFIMPRGYALFILAPYMVMFLLQGAVPLFAVLFDATYYGVILVPFGFAGIGLCYYLLKQIKCNAAMATLVIAALCPFAFLLFSAAGIIDYFLNLRFIIEHYKKNPIKKE
jgi:hypothetical protein